MHRLNPKLNQHLQASKLGIDSKDIDSYSDF